MKANTNPNSAESSARISSGQETTPPSADDHQVEERPDSLAGGSVDLYDSDGHHIWAELNAEGALVITGRDLRPPSGWDEYEYSFTIPPADLPLIRAALIGTSDDSVLLLGVVHSHSQGGKPRIGRGRRTGAQRCADNRHRRPRCHGVVNLTHRTYLGDDITRQRSGPARHLRLSYPPMTRCWQCV
jgi:hypothetical protein